MKLYLTILIFLPLLSYSQNRINGEITYDLNQNELKAELNISIDRSFLQTDTLRFILNAKTNIESVEGEMIKDFNFDDFYAIINARSNYLTLIVDTLHQKQTIDFSVKYSIHSYSDPLWKDQWFEFYSEIKGFPIMRDHNFDLDLIFDLPIEMNFFSSSALSKQENASYIYKATEVEMGPNVFGGREILIKEFSSGPFPELKVYSYFDEYGMMDTVGYYVEKALEYYHETFAKNDPQSDFTFAILPLITNVSFNRTAFTTFRFFRQGDRFIDGIPRTLKTPYHELAHMWWTNAPADTYDNWINESFAEYSAFLAIRELHGEELYQKYVENAKSNGEQFGPIIEYEPFYTYIFYTKGAYIVYELHQKMGEEDFINLTKDLIDSKVSTVKNCIELLKKKYSEEIADWLYMRLRE